MKTAERNEHSSTKAALLPSKRQRRYYVEADDYTNGTMTSARWRV